MINIDCEHKILTWLVFSLSVSISEIVGFNMIKYILQKSSQSLLRMLCFMMLIYIEKYNKSNKSSSILSSSVLLWFNMLLGIIQLIQTFVPLNLNFLLHNNTGIFLYVTKQLMTSFIQRALILLVVLVEYRFHLGQQQMCWSIFVTLLTSLTYGYKRLSLTTFNILVRTKKQWIICSSRFL